MIQTLKHSHIKKNKSGRECCKGGTHSPLGYLEIIIAFGEYEATQMRGKRGLTAKVREKEGTAVGTPARSDGAQTPLTNRQLRHKA